MKSKIFVFIALILVGILFGITSCQDINNSNSATVTFNLDLSKILKTSRNETSQNSEYILKVFAYNAAGYKSGEEIENLVLLAQTENKVGINGQVKASLDIEIGLYVIFVGKLYEIGGEKPIYSGNSEVVKIKATDNKVNLVLKRANTDLEIDIEVHEHTFATEWTSDETYHWHIATCEHTTEVGGKSEHDFTNGVCICGKVRVPEMVYIKGGTITGAKNENNYEGVFIEGRTVTLSNFYMGKYEVTQEEYASVMQGQKVTVDGVEYTLASDPSYCKKDSANYTLFEGDEQTKRPVEGVSWYDSVWYCNALSTKEGLTPAYNIEVTKVEQISGTTDYYIFKATVTLNKDATGYRLPTEAEWEYAARGGDPTKDDWNYMFSGADTAEGFSYDSGKNEGLDTIGWYKYNTIDGKTGSTEPTIGENGYGTHEVGKKAANRLGLYDMSGNVWEWCYDLYDVVSARTESDPTDASSGPVRVLRGGNWYSGASSASVSYRYYYYNTPNYRSSYLGFRVVRSATTE